MLLLHSKRKAMCSLRQCQCVCVEVDTYHIMWWIIQVKVSRVNT